MPPPDAASPQPTASLHLLTPFMRLLEDAGPRLEAIAMERTEPVLSRYGLSRPQLEADPTLRLPHPLMLALHSVFVEVLDDSAASLRAGLRVQPGDYELLDYLCRTAGTLAESVECLGRYYPLLGDATVELRREGDRAAMVFRLLDGVEAPPDFYEFAMASNFVLGAQHVRPEALALPLELRIAHPAPPHAELFPQLFGCPVRFDAGEYATVLPAQMLGAPLIAADPVLHGMLRRLADHELGALPRLNAFPSRVAQLIARDLEKGPTLDGVAAQLELSPSTLRSRLREQDLTFSALLDAQRRERASRELRDPSLSMSEIAFHLGFAHPPAFHRAVRRWFGKSASEYRGERGSHAGTRFWRER